MANLNEPQPKERTEETISIGAPAALRGYRLQHLYTLDRLLSIQEDRFEVQLEGTEDLDIYDSAGTLLEAIQVKALTDDSVTTSTLFSDGGDSFFRRTLQRLKQTPSVVSKVASFGPFGKTLKGAFGTSVTDRATTEAYLKEKGFVAADIEQLFRTIELEVASEARLEAEVLTRLSGAVTAGDIHSSFVFLSGWMFRAMEDRRRIRRADVINALTAVGRLVADTAAHHSEWFTTIVPIDDSAFSFDAVTLREEFYRAGITRHEHILASLDIKRTPFLGKMDDAFQKSSVLVVHGASGQGKTTMALRYLTDRVTGCWRFQIRELDDAAHAYRVATALTGHTRALGIPLVAYIDVRPRDTNWRRLVDALGTAQGIRVLVTVREEDWRRSQIDGTAIECADLELTFEEGEARLLFSAILDANLAITAIDFDEAWSQFGGSGPLMEFTFLLTQSESLRERLVRQVSVLREDVRRRVLHKSELELLRRVSVAAAYGAKLLLSRVVNDLDIPDANATLLLFEREYLIRRVDSGQCLDGLHPIRSQLLVSLLCDQDVSTSWAETAAVCLKAIHPGDIRSFLLHSFSRRQDELALLLDAVRDLASEDWIAAAGILDALLWLGVAQFARSANPLIDEIQRSYNGAWKLLPFDPGEVMDRHNGTGIDWSDFSGFLSPETHTQITAFAQRAAELDKSVIKSRAIAWLTHTRIPGSPRSANEWSAAATIAFWVGHWRIDPQNSLYPDLDDSAEAISVLPLVSACELYFALKLSSGPRTDQALDRMRDRLLERVQYETKTIWIEDDGVMVRAHYIYDIRVRVDMKDAHSETMFRVELLRRLLEREGYGAQGYGHLLGLPWERDESTKEGIPLRGLPPRRATAVNGMFNQLAELRFRPRTWEQHSFDVLTWRLASTAGLRILRQSLDDFLSARATTPFPDILVGAIATAEEFLTLRNSLPASAVDEWGKTGEGLAHQETEDALTRASVERHRGYLKALNDYQSSLLAFFKQLLLPLVWNYRLRIGDKRTVLEEMRVAEVRDNYARLPTYNLGDALSKLVPFQIAFSQKLARFVDPTVLTEIECSERNEIDRLWPIWYQFAMHPRWTCRDAQTEAEALVSSLLAGSRRKLRRSFRKLGARGLRITVLSESVLWENSRTLWLGCDAEDVVKAWSGFPDVVREIQPILQYTTGLQSLRDWVINLTWPRVNIVPLVRGRLLQPIVWSFLTPTLKNFSLSDPAETWRNFPSPIPQNLISGLHLETWSVQSCVELGRVQEDVVEALRLAYHGRSLRHLPRTNEVGKAITSAHISSIAADLSAITRRLEDSLQQVAHAFSSKANSIGGWERAVNDRPFFRIAFTTFLEFVKRVSAPTEAGDLLSQIEEVAVRFEGGELFVANLLLLQDALSESATP